MSGAFVDPAIPRAALVTGAARRLGRATTLALADAGFSVAVHARRHDDADAQAAAEDVRARGGKAIVLGADLMREAEVERLIPDATDALGPIGVLVNNASTFERDEWQDATRATWERAIEPNLRAPFVLMLALARALPDPAKGVIVNMVDQRVWSPTGHFLSYSVAKAGLWWLTQSMALALAPRVRVVGIGPGPTLPSPRQTPEQFAQQARATPLGHGTSPEEIARAIVALLGLPSVTGQMLALDGAQHLQWWPQRDRAPLTE